MFIGIQGFMRLFIGNLNEFEVVIKETKMRLSGGRTVMSFTSEGRETIASLPYFERTLTRHAITYDSSVYLREEALPMSTSIDCYKRRMMRVFQPHDLHHSPPVQ